jgi:hypothetical protein
VVRVQLQPPPADRLVIPPRDLPQPHCSLPGARTHWATLRRACTLRGPSAPTRAATRPPRGALRATASRRWATPARRSRSSARGSRRARRTGRCAWSSRLTRTRRADAGSEPRRADAGSETRCGEAPVSAPRHDVGLGQTGLLCQISLRVELALDAGEAR